MGLRDAIARSLRRLADAVASEEPPEHVLQRLALQDELTELANRASALQRLQAAQARHQRRGTLYALLYVDLDHFKPVNDRFGHRAGDAVLREFGRRMNECIRASDTAARIGGDEFLVLLEDLGADRDEARRHAALTARRIYASLLAPVDYDGVRIRVGASIGAVVAADGSVTPEDLIDLSDRAMYEAKNSDDHLVVN